jgi:hypothetical protein
VLIDIGEKVHIITRRLFDENLRRHFVGEVIAAEGVIVRLEGYSFIYDDFKTQYLKSPEKRTSIFDLAESGYIINIIPKKVDIKKLEYKTIDRSYLVITDGEFSLGINEFGIHR